MYPLSTNLSCVCTNSQFQADADACIRLHCSATELQDALDLETSECAAGTNSTYLFKMFGY